VNNTVKEQGGFIGWLIQKLGGVDSVGGKAVDNLSRRFTNLKWVIAKVGLWLATWLGLRAIRDIGLSFENARSEIVKTTGAFWDFANELNQNARNVFAQVPQSIDQVATAIWQINTRLWLTGVELEETTKRFLDFSRINNIDITTAIRTASQLINWLWLEANEANLLLDKLTKASQDYWIRVDTLAQSITDAWPAFEELGFGVNRSIALFSEFERIGARPTEVISSLWIALNKLAREWFTNAEEAFDEYLNRIKEAPSLLEAVGIATELFGSRVGAKVAEDIRAGRFEVDKYADSLEEARGVLERTAEESLTTSEKFKTLWNSLKVSLAPAIEWVFKLLNPIIESLIKIAQASPWLITSIILATGALGWLAVVASFLSVKLLIIAGVIWTLAGAYSFLTDRTIDVTKYTGDLVEKIWEYQEKLDSVERTMKLLNQQYADWKISAEKYKETLTKLEIEQKRLTEESNKFIKALEILQDEQLSYIEKVEAINRLELDETEYVKIIWLLGEMNREARSYLDRANEIFQKNTLIGRVAFGAGQQFWKLINRFREPQIDQSAWGVTTWTWEQQRSWLDFSKGQTKIPMQFPIEPIDELVEPETIKTLNTLNDWLKTLKDKLWDVEVGSEEFKSLQLEIKNTEDYIKELSTLAVEEWKKRASGASKQAQDLLKIEIEKQEQFLKEFSNQRIEEVRLSELTEVEKAKKIVAIREELSNNLNRLKKSEEDIAFEEAKKIIELEEKKRQETIKAEEEKNRQLRFLLERENYLYNEWAKIFDDVITEKQKKLDEFKRDIAWLNKEIGNIGEELKKLQETREEQLAERNIKAIEEEEKAQEELNKMLREWIDLKLARSLGAERLKSLWSGVFSWWFKIEDLLKAVELENKINELQRERAFIEWVAKEEDFEDLLKQTKEISKLSVAEQIEQRTRLRKEELEWLKKQKQDELNILLIQKEEERTILEDFQKEKDLMNERYREKTKSIEKQITDDLQKEVDLRKKMLADLANQVERTRTALESLATARAESRTQNITNVNNDIDVNSSVDAESLINRLTNY
jgi:TP901 family phage tail tape measure protein